jgi:hypothetical protein
MLLLLLMVVLLLLLLLLLLMVEVLLMPMCAEVCRLLEAIAGSSKTSCRSWCCQVLLLLVLLLLQVGLLRIRPAATGGHCHCWCILYVLHHVQQVLVHFLLVPAQQCRGTHMMRSDGAAASLQDG